MEKVSVNHIDVDGNAAIHYAAASGLLQCVEKLVLLGAIISIVNKGNITCCEMADEKDHKPLALMLELALVFQPVDESMLAFDSFQFDFDGVPGKVLLSTVSLTLGGVNDFIEDAIRFVGELHDSFYVCIFCLFNTATCTQVKWWVATSSSTAAAPRCCWRLPTGTWKHWYSSMWRTQKRC
jgi:hypothetical protein